MQNGLKLHFIQNYTNCQCQIIVLKCCFFLTNEREAEHTSKKQWLFQNRKSKNKKENKKIIVIIPKKERCTKTKAAGTRWSLPRQRVNSQLRPAYTGTHFSFWTDGLCFLTGFGSGFLLLNEIGITPPISTGEFLFVRLSGTKLSAEEENRISDLKELIYGQMT